MSFPVTWPPVVKFETAASCPLPLGVWVLMFDSVPPVTPVITGPFEALATILNVSRSVELLSLNGKISKSEKLIVRTPPTPACKPVKCTSIVRVLQPDEQLVVPLDEDWPA